jgi:alkylation response protein AidB-like acyl-CoA dehydrogenase
VADTAWDLLGAGLLDLPLPGHGETIVRWRALAEVAACDLAVAQLVEGHLEAQSIHADAGRPLADGLWAVWAGSADDARLLAAPVDDGWTLRGAKRWCSGARSVTTAVITARDDVGIRAFAVPVRGADLRFDPASWPAVGMALADSLVMLTDDLRLPASAELGEGANWFLERPGYWAAQIAQAATWYGGALGVARSLRAVVHERESDPLALVHLGFADAVCETIDATLERAAIVVDIGVVHAIRTVAWQARATIEQLVTLLLRSAGVALGASALCHDAAVARRVADLTVSLRRHGGEREYAALGADVLDDDRLG